MPFERDPTGKAQHDLGAKLDQGKTPVYRGLLAYFPRALAKVAELSAYGANKYAWKGWEHVPDGVNRYSDALGRHLLKEETEGPYDKEIENDPNYPACILHATQVAWNALARLDLMLRNMKPSRKVPAGKLPDTREQMDPK
jgi:Domain of unknown function (DUF5664)